MSTRTGPTGASNDAWFGTPGETRSPVGPTGPSNSTVPSGVEAVIMTVDARGFGGVVAVTGDRWVEKDVTGDIELEREYGDRLPVVLLDGKEHGYWRVEEERLLRDLTTPQL